MNSNNKHNIKRIAITTLDRNKAEFIEWSYSNKDILARHDIIATETTGNILEGTLNKPVSKLTSGPLGGYKQLGELLTARKVDVLIFFLDEGEVQAQQDNIHALLLKAIAGNCIVAFNSASADIVLNSEYLNAPNKDHSINDHLEAA